jgi:CHAT domain-containing protein/pimeloyl-ACP methyl ester carboxylesterase
MEALKISGKLSGQVVEQKLPDKYQDILSIRCQREVTLETSRSNGKLAELDGLEDDTLLELEFDGGYKRWMRAGDIRAEAQQNAAPDAATASFILTPSSFSTVSQRGAQELVLKYLRVLEINPLGDLGQPADTLVATLETRQLPRLGLYRCADPNELQLQPITNPTQIDARKPVLLFLHGTFSSTDGSFGELWESRQGYNAQAWLQRLFAPYGQQVFTLEHHTLTVSPVQNALQVLRLLPPGTCLHLISHSRGGLVGELLCQGKLQRLTRESGGYVPSEDIFTVEDLTLFAADVRKSDRDGLQEIETLLKEKKITVGRFVRVACPGRGTVLAAGRLENHLSVIFNVLNLIPAPRFQKLAEFVRLVLMAAAKKPAQPDELPGLEAMMPASPLVRLLNRPNVQLDSDLSIVAGNVKASSLLGRFKPWVTAKFFGEDNDFVVNTAGMYGGIRRLQGMRFYLDQRNDSSHFGYFRDPQVLDRVLNALQKPDSDIRWLPLRGSTPDSGSRGADPVRADGKKSKSTVYFIPGFMGSSLTENSSSVWLDMGTLSWGDFSELTMDKAGINPGGVLEPAYRPLLDMLDDSHLVVGFGYDWRRSWVDAGRRLGDALEHELDTAKAENRKIILRILAHSVGGLVVLAMLSEMPDIWKRLCDEADCRVVLLATPLRGMFASVQLLLGQHRLLGLLNMLDGKADAAEAKRLVAQFASYPGVLELLPGDYCSAEKWQALLGDEAFNQWPARNLLADAQRVQGQLQQVTLDTQRFAYVQGKARLTPDALLKDGERWRFRASSGGDGVILWSDLGQKVPTWYMPVEHGRMASHRDYFSTLQYLLDDGVSRQLEQAPPETGKVEDWLPDIQHELFPDEEELVAAALGYHTRLTQEEVRPQVEVRVSHGNLDQVCHPIVVGHYEGDSILSAEAVLDSRLGGRLSELQRMGLYPGAIGTSHVFLNPGKKPGGAVLVGLGEVGKLSAGQLVASFTRAMMDYALVIRENLDKTLPEVLEDDADFIPVHVATLLIGTVGGGSIGLADSITSILRAIMQANMALDQTEQGARLRLQVVEFIELYEDRAVEAARLVQDMVLHPEFHSGFTLRTLMQILPGSRSRVMYNDPPGWWRRIQIEANQDGLKYTTLTDRARAELSLQATQRKLVDQFLDKAMTSSSDDPDTGKILFELLLPAEMKDDAPNTDNLVLVLDPAASIYPWELLYNRLDLESQPLSVRVGMLRQLLVGQYRQRVVSPLERSALVIGDPPTDGNFVRLPSAKQEATTVANLLEAGGFSRVVREIGTDSQSILKALHTGDYRVLHLAGHGVYQYQPDPTSDLKVSGMVLGNGIFLTPVEIGQMRRVPELAFVNCCHLARMDFMEAGIQTAVSANRSKLAASLAEELIEIGVRAVVAAGWAINDAAAQVFAQACYNALLRGYSFGKAVLMARRETWSQYPDSNTWGAYQCYGDPDYKLLSREPGDEDKSQSTDAWRFVAEVEVLAELQNLSNSADTAQTSDFPWLQDHLQQLHRAIPAEWLNHAPVLAALGRAYGKLDMFAKAIEAYDAALNSPQADYPVTLLEDKVSLQTSWVLAWSQGKADPPDTRVAASPAAMMEDSLTVIRLLEGLGNSLQRMEEEGKFWKRQAMMSEGEGRNRALHAMEDAYRKAYDFAVQETGSVAGYPLINWLTAKMVRYLRGQVKHLDRKELKESLDQARQCVDTVDRLDVNFCSGVTRAECTLLQYLVGARLNETMQVQKVVDDYRQAIGRGAAPRQLRFVAEHLMFLRLMLGEFQEEKPQLQPVVTALLEVEGKVVV